MQCLKANVVRRRRDAPKLLVGEMARQPRPIEALGVDEQYAPCSTFAQVEHLSHALRALKGLMGGQAGPEGGRGKPNAQQAPPHQKPTLDLFVGAKRKMHCNSTADAWREHWDNFSNLVAIRFKRAARKSVDPAIDRDRALEISTFRIGRQLRPIWVARACRR